MTVINVNQPLLDAVKECAEVCTKQGLPHRHHLNGQNSLGAYCGVWASLYYDGVYALKSGPCHSGIDYNRDDKHTKSNTIAIISWPYTSREKATTKEVKEEAGFSEEFLDAYYTWLTTTPILEGVFLEPWNGEYLVVNPSAPANAVLMALIASRIPTETIAWGVEKQWRELIEGGVSWTLSLVVIAGFVAGGRVNGNKHYSTESFSASNHAVFNRQSMNQDSLIAIANEVPIKDVKGAVVSLPYNNGGFTRRVFAIYDRGIALSDHLIEVSKSILNVKVTGSGWNRVERPDPSVNNFMEQFLPHVLKWQDELIIKQEKKCG